MKSKYEKELREVMSLIGIDEYKKLYEERINRIGKNIPRSLIISFIVPIIIITLAIGAAAVFLGIKYASFPGGLLTFSMSFFMIISCGFVFGVRGVMKKIGRIAAAITTLSLEIFRDFLEKSEKEAEIPEIEEFIKSIVYGIIIPRLGKGVRDGIRIAGFQVFAAIRKIIDAIIDDALLYIKENIKNREVNGYLVIKADKYRETLSSFIEGELFDIQESGGKYISLKVREHIGKVFEKTLGSERAAKLFGAVNSFKNSKEERSKKIDEFEKTLFKKFGRGYGKAVFGIGALGAVLSLWGIGQIIMLYFILAR